jgi:hypothetical protein
MARNALALSYAEHILIASQVGDRSAPFRTFFDNWFAFRMAGPFLNQNSRPHWFNNPSPDKHGSALENCHFVSCGAARVLSGMSRDRLVKDHCVPVSTLREIIIDRQPQTIEDVEGLLLQFYRVGVLTKAEDDRLTAVGLRSEMPAGWTTAQNVFARYSEAEIIGQEPSRGFPKHPQAPSPAGALRSARTTTWLSSRPHG